ncbi:MAG: Glu/Leu/Phe/Val dehydrogenase [Candidatus Moranbacteria bacterium]|nr:Glu/Leu/Phe/Val dehydrogenase [Candidatus Moranbacteria bacterium]MBP9801902.1 Glu/Leu/Phe/Val dehydrogenase [Candidatus Moranbacteria bacterium]
MNPLETAREQLRSAQKIIRINPDIFERLLLPDRLIEVSIPVRMDTGRTKVFTGFRSQWNDAAGPYKGGIRFHPGVTREEVMALSSWMTWKTAVLGLPLGGGKGGVVVDVKGFSDHELEALSRAYIRSIAPFIGKNKDIPAPDVSTDPRVMGWMLDEYEVLIGEKSPGVITGKPLSIGGSLVRDYATAQGAFFVLENAVKKLHLPDHSRVAIQGFGNGGGHIARLLQESGYRVIAISDSKSTVYREEGLDVAEIETHKRSTGSLKKCLGCESLPSEALLTVPCDILIPAALEGAISSQNVKDIRAKLIVEVANGPVTSEADKFLFDRGTVVVPDILANAGGVTVSYFEQVQNAMNAYWTESEINQKLKEKMQEAFEAVWASHEKYNTTLRMGAYIVALERVAAAMQARGRM